MSTSETAFWRSGLTNTDAIISTKLNKNVLEVLGYKCDELILICKSGIQKYYFNSALKVDISLFESHKFGTWYHYLKESKALPLKMIFDTAQFTMENIATEIKEIKLNEQDLQLPETQ